MDSLWIGFGLNMLEQNGYGLDLELELSPSDTSGCEWYFSIQMYALLYLYALTCINLALEHVDPRGRQATFTCKEGRA